MDDEVELNSEGMSLNTFLLLYLIWRMEDDHEDMMCGEHRSPGPKFKDRVEQLIAMWREGDGW